MNDTASLIASEGGRALVVGLSLGGYVTMLLAASHPALVSGLVVCGASVNFTGALGVYLKTVAWILERGWMKPGGAKLEARTRALFPASLADVADLQIKDGLYPQALGPAFASMARTDFLAALGRYEGPVLLLNGEHDRAARKGEAAFAAVSRHARIETIHQKQRRPDVALARERLEWAPSVAVRDGLAATIEYFRAVGA